MLLLGYALLSDVVAKTGSSYGALHVRKSLVKDKFGERTAIKIDSLSEFERGFDLADLGYYTTPKLFSLFLGMSVTYISVYERWHKIEMESVRINGRVRLIRIPDVIADMFHSGKTIYKLEDGEVFDGEPLDFYGIKLGYY